MKLYHFIQSSYGLNALEDGCIKVSRLDDMNDPFELYGVNIKDKELRRHFRSYKHKMAKKSFMLCCSMSWKSPLLWSHYADRHKGIALVLEADNSIIQKVTYQKSKIRIDERKMIDTGMSPGSLALRLLTTKYEQWSYEEEARIFINPDEIRYKNDLPFYDFDSQIRVTGLVLGPLCNLSRRQISESLNVGDNLRLTKARLGIQHFNVVKDKSYKYNVINKQA